MSGMHFAALFVFAAIGQDVAAVGKPEVEVSMEVRPMQLIGNLKSGLICTPAGSLRWQDIARESDQDIAAKISQAIAGYRSSHSRPRILVSYAKVVSATLKMCVPWHGIVGKPKGAGSITVRWIVKKDGSGEPSFDRNYVIALALTGRDPRKDTDVLSEALVKSAVKFATDLP